MNRDRFVRPRFDIEDLNALADQPDAWNRLVFDWWCDESDRRELLAHWRGAPRLLWSRAPLELDPSPPLDRPAVQGRRPVWLLSDPRDVERALTSTLEFSNAPYAELGGGSFVLAQDPVASGIDWHAEQRALIMGMLDYPSSSLRLIAERAVEQAALTALARDEFDVAVLAEQAALRFFGLLYGYAVHDHGVLEDASRSVYRALQYVVFGQHFATEPLTLPTARAALGRLVDRSSQLMTDYPRFARSARRHGPVQRQRQPDGVVAWSEQGLACVGSPVLARLETLPGLLGARDRASIAATLLAGTVGNLVSATCLVVDTLLDDAGKRAAWPGNAPTLFAARPPLPIVPRRTRRQVTLSGNTVLDAGVDCLVLLGDRASAPEVWGQVAAGGTHACLGRHLASPLLEALVPRILRLPQLRRALDPLTGTPLPLERLWGFGCTRLPLLHERNQIRPRPLHNLIVAMRVRSPVGEHAAALRRLIAGAVPRIEQVLTGFGHVSHAWFEFSDGDTQLVLRTLYAGDFDSYIEHFALFAGDLFDSLFEHLEDAPARPVAEHPDDFIDTVRRFNRAPLAGYLYSRGSP